MLAALTIAGSDPIGGAGLQADIKAFGSLGVHGTCVVTCITSQNTMGVKDIFPLPPETIRSQMEAVLEDADVGAAKTGMLFSAEIVRTVCDAIEGRGIPLVVDPVMVAGVGDSLHSPDMVEAMRSRLVPMATLITPNVPEAESLTRTRISTKEEVEEACLSLAKLGAEAVLLKGGHLDSTVAEDTLLLDGELYTFSSPRVNEVGHGGGCTLSAYLAAFLAKGLDLLDAVARSKECIWKAFSSSYGVGKGVTLVDPLSPLREEGSRYEMLSDLRSAVDRLESMLPPRWVPEVGMNFVYALPSALTPTDVCAVEGRISPSRGRLVHAECLDFGSSQHVATIALTAMAHDRSMRSALNLRFSEENLGDLKESGLMVGSFSRADEPLEGKRTMEWGTEKAILEMGTIPDAIYDRGGVGKEPMIRILGKDPEDVLIKLRRIIDLR